MAKKSSPIINLNSKELKDIMSFCDLNELDFDEFINSCFNKGYQIEKYGLLTTEDGRQVIVEEKEVIKEVRVEIPVEVEKIIEKEIIIEVPVEVEKIVEVEKPIKVFIEKLIDVTDDEQINELTKKIKELEESLDMVLTDTEMEISELSKKIRQLENVPPEVIEKEVIIEKPVEVIKEVIIEVTKEIKVDNKDKLKLLQETISTMKDDIRKKDEKILQIEKNVVELEKVKGPIKAKFMGSTNLNDNLYR